MAIILVILCLVGAMAGSTFPAAKSASSAPTAVALPVVPTQPNSAIMKNSSCDAHSRFRDLSLPAAAQRNRTTIELCHDP